MRLRIAAFLILIGTILVATYMHESYHRYDLVTAGAGSGGSGGSQDESGKEGDVRINAYLIDHRTGRVWMHSDIGVAGSAALNSKETGAAYSQYFRFVPMERLNCADVDAVEVDGGCRPKAK
jgi:hypothetical protein